jgi:hypothetical protein
VLLLFEKQLFVVVFGGCFSSSGSLFIYSAFGLCCQLENVLDYVQRFIKAG